MNLSIKGAANYFLGTGTPNKEEPRKPLIDPATLGEKKILLSWEAFSRPHTNDDASMRMTRSLTMIGIVIAFVLVILQEFFLLLLIGSMLFVRYVLTKVPPETITYTLSTHGISIGDDQYFWVELNHFFFTEMAGSPVVAIDINGVAFPRIYVTYLHHDKEKIKHILSEHLVYLEQVPRTVFDKTYDSVMDKLNVK